MSWHSLFKSSFEKKYWIRCEIIWFIIEIKKKKSIKREPHALPLIITWLDHFDAMWVWFEICPWFLFVKLCTTQHKNNANLFEQTWLKKDINIILNDMVWE